MLTVEERLDELMRACREDGHVLCYRDLVEARFGSHASAPAIAPATEAEYLRMRSATHDHPACAIFRGGRCTCDAQDTADAPALHITENGRASLKAADVLKTPAALQQLEAVKHLRGARGVAIPLTNEEKT